jgi:CheY-like chemotaxis protein
MQNDQLLAGLRILVVEDEPIVAWDLADGLGLLAEQLSQERGLDGAVLDVNLGGEKVFPVADILAGRNIPFCFVTGYGVAGLRPDDSARPILQKPVDPERIARIAQHWRAP